jgi:SRSO17 transposase
LDSQRWGLPREAVLQLGDDLYAFWTRYRIWFQTRTRDTSTNAYLYWRGQLTLEDARNFANIERRLSGRDGQALQQFMSDSPWDAAAVFRQIQSDIRHRPDLQTGGILILDESADEKAGLHSAGAGRQHNGRLGKVELSVVATCLAFAHPATGTWTLVDGELFLPQAWFTPEYAELCAALGVPETRTFQTKPELGLAMIRCAQAQGLPFEGVACDDLYGRSRTFRANLDAEGIPYAAEVPANTQVYLAPPRVRVPRRRHNKGKKPTRRQVLSRQKPREIRHLVPTRPVRWQRVRVRHPERGWLEADFWVQRVWTLTEVREVRAEWLVVRRDADGKLTCVLENAPADTSLLSLIKRSCQRYFTERTYQDAKSELGWADFQAQKYRAWQHHMALTAASTWFVAEEKLNWRQRYACDPELLRQLDVEVLPALSTANVRELLQAVLPVPQLTPAEAQQVVVRHLIHRARSTSSREHAQREHDDSS